jgi:hypothetical protein
MEPTYFDASIQQRKWLGKLVASAKGHARKASRPFELTTEFIEICMRSRGRALRDYGVQFSRQRFPEALSNTRSHQAYIGGRLAADIPWITCGSCVSP